MNRTACRVTDKALAEINDWCSSSIRLANRALFAYKYCTLSTHCLVWFSTQNQTSVIPAAERSTTAGTERVKWEGQEEKNSHLLQEASRPRERIGRSTAGRENGLGRRGENGGRQEEEM